MTSATATIYEPKTQPEFILACARLMAEQPIDTDEILERLVAINAEFDLPAEQKTANNELLNAFIGAFI